MSRKLDESGSYSTVLIARMYGCNDCFGCAIHLAVIKEVVREWTQGCVNGIRAAATGITGAQGDLAQPRFISMKFDRSSSADIPYRKSRNARYHQRRGHSMLLALA